MFYGITEGKRHPGIHTANECFTGDVADTDIYLHLMETCAVCKCVVIKELCVGCIDVFQGNAIPECLTVDHVHIPRYFYCLLTNAAVEQILSYVVDLGLVIEHHFLLLGTQ